MDGVREDITGAFGVLVKIRIEKCQDFCAERDLYIGNMYFMHKYYRSRDSIEIKNIGTLKIWYW